MNKNVRNAGIALLAAGALAYPAMRLYRFVKQRREGSPETTGANNRKAFSPSYLGDNKPHRRKAEPNQP
ncbi:MAG: hypothetical protein JNL72_01775 [Flavipsychrobacter sp.]|nr:hypothetical protein [Flavipsychrobacter sp.]